jgi:hypothetical protein
MSTIVSCQKCKQNFEIDQDDQDFYARIKVPHPTFCPECRVIRRLSFRNERGLYKRKCDFSGKEIFSMYSSDSPVKVYERDVWLSDAWDPMEYGQEVDWNRPFLSQLYELMLKVPFKATNVIRGSGSPYSNNATDPKNCYLVFNTTKPEDCMYSNGVNHSRECVDVSHVSNAETCYESFWVGTCYRCNFCSMCVESSDLWFCRDLQGCMNCFGSANLRNKSYYFFNTPCTKEEYEKKVAEYNLHTREGILKAKKDSEEFWKTLPNKSHQGIKNVDCTGSYVSNSKNVKDSFFVRESENLRYCQYLQETPGVKDCYDFSIWGDGAELVYEATSCGTGVSNVKFALLTQENVHDTEYTIACTNGSAYLFGCVGLRKKEYCILNKQYSKDEYFTLVDKIKKHMIEMPYVDKNGYVYKYGEYFPSEFSPFAYNETLAQEYFPLGRDEAISKGYRWRDVEKKNYVPTINAKDIPSNIKETRDNIVDEILECEHAGECNHNCPGAFKIIPNELTFYKKIGVPLPTLCSPCRTLERLNKRLPIGLNERQCDCDLENHNHDGRCGNIFQTGFKKENGDVVYCETCYQEEIL